MITRENYEEYMMMHADGELSPSQEQELMSFLYEHPEYQHELTAFNMAKLIPDDSLVYTRKVSLLKPEGGAMVVPFAPWKRYAIAAGVAAVLMLGGYNLWNYQNGETPVVAVNDRTDSTTEARHKAVAVNSAPEITTQATATPVEVKETKTNTTIRIHEWTGKSVATAERGKTANRKPIAPAQEMQANTTLLATNETPINTVHPAALVTYKNIPEISSAVVTNVPPATIYMYEGNNETKTSIVDKLPIDELKKEGMENVVTAMANGYDKINAIKQGISETVVSFKVEKRKLIVSF